MGCKIDEYNEYEKNVHEVESMLKECEGFKYDKNKDLWVQDKNKIEHTIEFTTGNSKALTFTLDCQYTLISNEYKPIKLQNKEYAICVNKALEENREMIMERAMQIMKQTLEEKFEAAKVEARAFIDKGVE